MVESFVSAVIENLKPTLRLRLHRGRNIDVKITYEGKFCALVIDNHEVLRLCIPGQERG